MKLKSLILVVFIFGLISCGVKEVKEADLTTDKAKASYAIGQNVGSSFKQQQLTTDDIELNAFNQGVADALKDTSVVEQADLQQALMAFQKEMTAKAEERKNAASELNKKEGETFLAENKTKEDVQVTESGLQYKVITEGTGASPKSTDKVTVNYEGKLISGKVFDSSYERGEPTSFGVNQVIPGWTEGLQLMKEGSTFEFFIPSNLAYGERGAGGNIGPDATLIFKVELIKVN
ncbi:MAG: FKBP-type peptidyl-prolyl cis-trans isomerase [Melioribacteraceae bacterium]|nr:FKBP-type peptidyl-prolyl cis-trans isomerase [Melioribacteraceae bacterium]